MRQTQRTGRGDEHRKNAHRNNAQRIVSLVPSVTSILLALGAERELVGVSKWCKEVADVGSRKQVGDCWKLDVAEVMRLKPTLLIGSVPFASETVGEILKQPVSFLAINPRSLADIESNIRLLGRVAGRESRAERVIGAMRQGFERVGRRVAAMPARRKPRVYCEAWPNPRISSPPWVAELIQMAGGRAVGRSGARVTDKDVAEAKPDLIVLAWAATGKRAKPERALRNPAWKDVTAVKLGQVAIISDELLNTPGPPLVKGAWELFRAIEATERRES